MKKLSQTINESIVETNVKKVTEIIRDIFTNWESASGKDIYSQKLGDFTWEILDAIYMDGENPGALDDIQSWLNDK